MQQRAFSFPFIVVLMGIGAVSMILPGAHAAAVEDFHVMRAFLQSSMIMMFLTSLVAIATRNQVAKRQGRSFLLALLGTFIVLPLMLAIPFHEAVRNTSFLNSYFEMVSSLTTTGATLFEPERLPDSVHLWRGLVGWMGGLFVWITAVAVLAPMNLGGFEVLVWSSGQSGAQEKSFSNMIWASDTTERLARYGMRLFPIYSGLTLVLWAALMLAGDTPLVSFIHAMSTLATSGISPLGGTQTAASGIAGEALIFLFLMFALSRQIFSPDRRGVFLGRIWTDPEFRLGIMLVIILPLFLFLRHWIGAIEVNDAADTTNVFRALWGGVFTVLSFLTTTGFEASGWNASRSWSGLETPGLILMGLALLGGGVATTAGGVKLLRVYALYKHGIREMDRLVHPSSVGGAGIVARGLRRQGAQAAWIFFMLYALSLGFVALILAFAGLDFEAAITLAVASLTTTGPLASVAPQTPIDYALLPDTAKLILAGAMVVGRLEALAIIALLNPDFWRS